MCLANLKTFEFTFLTILPGLEHLMWRYPLNREGSIFSLFFSFLYFSFPCLSLPNKGGFIFKLYICVLIFCFVMKTKAFGNLLVLFCFHFESFLIRKSSFIMVTCALTLLFNFEPLKPKIIFSPSFFTLIACRTFLCLSSCDLSRPFCWIAKLWSLLLFHIVSHS